MDTRHATPEDMRRLRPLYANSAAFPDCEGRSMHCVSLCLYATRRSVMSALTTNRPTAGRDDGARISIVSATGAAISHSPIKPKSPRMELKTSMTRILTNSVGFAASANAAFEPEMPTATPHRRLHMPIVRPPKKSENPATSRGQLESSPLRVHGSDREKAARTCEVVVLGV